MTNKKYYSSVSQIIFIVLFTASSIGINYLGSVLAGLIAFPLYLDSVMTIAVTALCGLIPGLICAVASNLLLYIFANTGIIFMPCHISTAVIAYFVFRAERKIILRKNCFPLPALCGQVSLQLFQTQFWETQ